MQGIICPNCNTDDHVREYEIDDLYVCVRCGKVLGYRCSGCEHTYLSNRLGLHGDVYECKICGKIQWGYTEWKRNQEANKTSET